MEGGAAFAMTIVMAVVPLLQTEKLHDLLRSIFSGNPESIERKSTRRKLQRWEFSCLWSLSSCSPRTDEDPSTMCLTITHIEKHILNLKFTPWALSSGA